MAGWTAAAIASSAVIGGIASNKAADTQAEAADRATAEQRRQFNKQVALQQPLIDARNNALPDLIAASYYSPFDYNAYQNDPGVGFRLREGLKTLDRSAAARGALLGGNQLRGITQFGQDLASQEYTNAFNRYQAERQAKLGPLQSLVGLGQTSANTVGNAAAQYGNAMAENALMRGNMRASGYMNTANAITGALGTGLNYYQNQQMMDKYFPHQQRAIGGGTAGANAGGAAGFFD